MTPPEYMLWCLSFFVCCYFVDTLYHLISLASIFVPMVTDFRRRLTLTGSVTKIATYLVSKSMLSTTAHVVVAYVICYVSVGTLRMRKNYSSRSLSRRSPLLRSPSLTLCELSVVSQEFLLPEVAILVVRLDYNRVKMYVVYLSVSAKYAPCLPCLTKLHHTPRH